MAKIQKKQFIFSSDVTYVPPKVTYSDRDGFAKWGDKNKYPSEMIDLYNYNGSPIFKAIINKKVKLIVKDINAPHNQRYYRNLINKLAYDLEILNGFALQVIKSNDNTKVTQINHIPFKNIRVGGRNDEGKLTYFYKQDWTDTKEPTIEYTEFDLNNDDERQLYVFMEYNPENEYYPIPNYSNVVNWIKLDAEISKFHLNNASNNYYPSYILNINSGYPTDEEAEEFAKDFKRNFAGTSEAGKIIITYSDGKEAETTITPVPNNHSDEMFKSLMEVLPQKIASGLEIPLGLVIETAGKLGGTGEKIEMQKEFYDSYISNRQWVIIDSLNDIIAINNDGLFSINEPNFEVNEN